MNDINMEDITEIDYQKYYDMVIELVINHGPRILFTIIGALLTLWIGFKMIRFVTNLIDKGLTKAKVDTALKNFMQSVVGVLLKVLLLLAVAGMLGIQTTSFIAIIGAAGLAIGMALSGTLQNFAGGVMILLFKPFKIGDFIEAAGYAGTVSEIRIFNTILLTGDKKTVVIPNNDISNGSLTNYSTQPKRRLDLDIGIAYTDSIKKAKDILLEIAKTDESVLQDETILVAVKSLGDSAVIITFRVFVNSEDYWDTFFRMNETIKETFDEKGLNFPFPQRDVHLYKEV